MTTYTVTDHNGTVLGRGLLAREAMAEKLNHDSHGFEVRREADGEGWALWTTPFSRASTLGGRPMVRSRFFSLDDDETLALNEIAVKVLAADFGGTWPTATTDQAYDEMMAQIAKDEQE